VTGKCSSPVLQPRLLFLWLFKKFYDKIQSRFLGKVSGVYMKKNSKRIAALIAVFLLVGLYVATFVVAILDFPYKENLFMACAASTVLVPILLWVYIWLFGIMTNRRSMATVWPEENLPHKSSENMDPDEYDFEESPDTDASDFDDDSES